MMENEWRMVEIDGRKYRERAMATTSPSGGTVKIVLRRPILTEEEWIQREKELLDALQRFGKSAIDQNVKI